jgi:hypothetical protein
MKWIKCLFIEGRQRVRRNRFFCMERDQEENDIAKNENQEGWIYVKEKVSTIYFK